MQIIIILSIIIVVFLVISTGIFLLQRWVENYVKKQILKAGDRIFGREIKVANVEFNLWNCSTTIHQIAIPNAPGYNPNFPAIAIEKTYFNLFPLDILKNKLHLKQLRFDKVSINVEINDIPLSVSDLIFMLAKKDINLLALKDTLVLKERKKNQQHDTSKTLYIQVDQLEIFNTQVSLVNLTVPLQLLREKLGILKDKNFDRITLPDYKINNLGKDRPTTVDNLVREILKVQYERILRKSKIRFKVIKSEVIKKLNLMDKIKKVNPIDKIKNIFGGALTQTKEKTLSEISNFNSDDK
jgi:hypothetical protein